MKVYVTMMEDFESGENQLLKVFRHYEKARDFCIREANSSVLNTVKYVELDYEREGEYFAIGVYWPAEEVYGDEPDATRRYFVVTKEVVN